MLLHIPKPNLRRSTISFSASKHLHYLAIGIMEQKTHIISAFQARIEFAEEIIAFCWLFFEVAVSLFQLSVIYKMFWANYGNLLLCFSLNGQHLLDAILQKFHALYTLKLLFSWALTLDCTRSLQCPLNPNCIVCALKCIMFISQTKTGISKKVWISIPNSIPAFLDGKNTYFEHISLWYSIRVYSKVPHKTSYFLV